jgi:Ca2+/H+ antiporter
MDRRFTRFRVVAVCTAVVVVSFAPDVESHWMEGAMLLAVYWCVLPRQDPLRARKTVA